MLITDTRKNYRLGGGADVYCPHFKVFL